MKVWEVDVVNLVEMCVAWENYVTRRVVQEITKKIRYKASCWTVAASNIDLSCFLKPGGTGTLAMGQCNGMIMERGVDPWSMGWWSYILLGDTGNCTNFPYLKFFYKNI